MSGSTDQLTEECIAKHRWCMLRRTGMKVSPVGRLILDTGLVDAESMSVSLVYAVENRNEAPVQLFLECEDVSADLIT